MKKILPLILLSACSSIPSNIDYRGESATYAGDNILRNDITNTIIKYEETVNNCKKIQTIEASVENLLERNGLYLVQEYWQVTACNQSTTYDVRMQQLPNGETNYHVGLVK